MNDWPTDASGRYVPNPMQAVTGGSGGTLATNPDRGLGCGGGGGTAWTAEEWNSAIRGISDAKVVAGWYHEAKRYGWYSAPASQAATILAIPDAADLHKPAARVGTPLLATMSREQKEDMYDALWDELYADEAERVSGEPTTVSDILLAIADLTTAQKQAVYDAIGQALDDEDVDEHFAPESLGTPVEWVAAEDGEYTVITGRGLGGFTITRQVAHWQVDLTERTPHPLSHLTNPPDWREAMVAEED